jgi:hypothetical protein
LVKVSTVKVTPVAVGWVGVRNNGDN